MPFFFALYQYPETFYLNLLPDSLLRCYVPFTVRESFFVLFFCFVSVFCFASFLSVLPMFVISHRRLKLIEGIACRLGDIGDFVFELDELSKKHHSFTPETRR